MTSFSKILKELKIWIILLYLAVVLYMLGEKNKEISYILTFVKHNPLQTLAIFIGIISSSVLFLKIYKKFTANEFSQVDREVYNKSQSSVNVSVDVDSNQPEEKLNENPKGVSINKLEEESDKKLEEDGDEKKSSAQSSTTLTKGKVVAYGIQRPIEISPYVKQVTHFEQYCVQVVNIFQQKSESADRKASILLARGITLSALGIILYILSIFIWQWRANDKGLNHEMILGVISSTFLFIFIEFLSAWFLKQYRHFVDTSTYLMKVKSIFDKYMLLALFAKDMSDVKNMSDIRKTEIVKILGEEIKWPDISNYSREDVSFAKEAMETASLMLTSAKGLFIKEAEKEETSKK